MFREFINGFVKGAKETPRGFFAPLIVLWRLYCKMYESIINEASHKKDAAGLAVQTHSALMTPAGGNVFADLGFSPEESAALLAKVHNAIKEELAAKAK